MTKEEMQQVADALTETSAGDAAAARPLPDGVAPGSSSDPVSRRPGSGTRRCPPLQIPPTSTLTRACPRPIPERARCHVRRRRAHVRAPRRQGHVPGVRHPAADRRPVGRSRSGSGPTGIGRVLVGRVVGGHESGPGRLREGVEGGARCVFVVCPCCCFAGCPPWGAAGGTPPCSAPNSGNPIVLPPRTALICC